MALVGTQFYVSDNSGAKRVQCIRIVDRSPSIRVGTTILVSVKELRNPGKLSKGDLKLAVVVTMKRPTMRWDGSGHRASRNAVVLVDTKKEPLGSRIHHVAAYDLLGKGYAAVVAKAPYGL